MDLIERPAFAELKPVDWQRVQADYDYLWAYRVPELAAPLAAVGTQVLEDGDLKIYKLGH